MAVGDVVTDTVAASTDYQPASGVETCITYLATAVANAWFAYDGTNTTGLHAATAGGYNVKVFTNNANYIRSGASAGNHFYSGVQVK